MEISDRNREIEAKSLKGVENWSVSKNIAHLAEENVVRDCHLNTLVCFVFDSTKLGNNYSSIRVKFLRQLHSFAVLLRNFLPKHMRTLSIEEPIAYAMLSRKSKSKFFFGGLVDLF